MSKTTKQCVSVPEHPHLPARGTHDDAVDRAPYRSRAAARYGPELLTTGGQGSRQLRTQYLLTLQRTRGNKAVARMIEAHSQDTPVHLKAQAGAQPARREVRKPEEVAPPARRKAAQRQKPRSPAAGARRGRPAARVSKQAPRERRPSLPAGARKPARPAPRPQPMQAAVTGAQAAIAAVPQVQMPEPASAGSKILLETLRIASQKGRDDLTAAADATLRSAADTVAEQSAQANAAEAESVAAVEQQAQGARGAVADAISENTAAVKRTESGEQAKLADWQGQATGRAQEEVGKRQESVTALGGEHAAQIRTSGERSAEATRSKLASGSEQARSEQHKGGGGGEAGQGHAEVASRLGGEAAQQFDSAADEVGGTLRGHASEAAEALDQHTAQAATVLGTHTAVLQQQIGETAAGAGGELSEAAGAATVDLRAGGKVAQQALENIETTVVDRIHTRSAEHREQIQTAGTEAAAKIREQTASAITAAGQQMERDAASIAEAQIGEQAATEAAAELQTHVAGAFAGASEQVRGIGDQITTRLTSAGQEVTGALRRVPGQAGPGISSAAAAVQSEVSRASGEAMAAMSRAAAATIAGGNQAVSTTAQKLDQAVAQSKTAFASVSDAAGRSLNEYAADTENRAGEAVQGLKGRIAEGHRRVDGFVAQQGATVQRSVLGAIGSWFAEQFRDLWDMLSSPSFWVGLVVTIALFGVLGPGALVVGGLVGGIVGGIEQNIEEGKSWYDIDNILKNALVGAAAGAAMALGVGVIIGLGLEGIAAVAAVMGLSAVIGIVVNLATEQRWDKGLLANLLLAWLFQRIFGAKGRKGAEEAPPKPPGRTTEKVPGLYEGIDPATKPSGWVFDDVVTTFPEEVMVRTDVTAPDGTTGHIIRGRNPATGEFIQHEAFLDRIPSDVRWIPTSPEMVPGRGTPLESYLTLRQMKMLEGLGAGTGAFTGPRVVKLSTIINVETCLKLAADVKGGTPANQAVLNTHSVQYASNSIIQTGGKIASAKVEGGFNRPAGSIGASAEQLTKYGIAPTEEVLFFFDITLDVVPATPPPAPVKGPRVHVPVPDDRDKR